MYRSIDLAGGVRFAAVPETAEAMDGDHWFWTDDNAKILEFLSRPELWARYPSEVGEILHFVRSMCRPPFIFRRVSVPQLSQAEGDGALATYRHSLMNIRCDLHRGLVAAGMRFHDERNFLHVSFFGNRVEFTYHRRRFELPVEDNVSEVDVKFDGRTLTLRYSSDLQFTPQEEPVCLGRIDYVYTFDAPSTLFEVEVSLDLADVEVSDVILTVSHDQLGELHYGTIDADTRTTAEALFHASKPGRHMVDVAGASYYVIRHRPFSGDSLAIHTLPRKPAQLAAIEAVSENGGELSRVVTRYSFPGRQSRIRLTAGEHKLLTGGGFYNRIDDYIGFMRDAIAHSATQLAAYDYSISYDYGVVLNAFAKCFAACGVVPGLSNVDQLQGELRALIDVYLRHYLSISITGHREGRNTVFSRELAFVILATVTMYQATDELQYRTYLGELCNALLDLEWQYADVTGAPASGFIQKIDVPRKIAHVDCHSASLFALVQAAPLVGDDRLIAAIDRGLRAYCLQTAVVDLGRPHRVDAVGTLLIDEAGAPQTETTYWNFKVGLTLRLFLALRNSADQAVQAVAAKHRERIELFEMILRHQLQETMTIHDDDGVEFRCSALSAETNSETQPWVMLGLIGHPAD